MNNTFVKLNRFYLNLPIVIRLQLFLSTRLTGSPQIKETVYCLNLQRDSDQNFFLDWMDQCLMRILMQFFWLQLIPLGTYITLFQCFLSRKYRNISPNSKYVIVLFEVFLHYYQYNRTIIFIVNMLLGALMQLYSGVSKSKYTYHYPMKLLDLVYSNYTLATTYQKIQIL